MARALQSTVTTSVRPSRNPPPQVPSAAPRPLRLRLRLCPLPDRVDDEKQVEAKGFYKLFRTAVDLLEEDPTDVPPLVHAWRRGLLDFHDIKYSRPPNDFPQLT